MVIIRDGFFRLTKLMTIHNGVKKDRSAILKLIRAYPNKVMQTYIPPLRDFVVAKERGKIIGCCALQIYSKRIAEVRSLAVDKNYQGKGIATKLVKACLTRAQSKQIYEVLSITGALNFFKKLGFNTFNNEKYAMLKVVTPRK